MNKQQKQENAKIIGIGNDGISLLDSISDKVVNTMDIEKISINQNVDKDYVRGLLDGVDLLFLTYNTEDKKSIQIVNAIGYMANERRVLSIGINSSEKDNKDNINLNREFRINDENKDDLLNIINMLIDSISDLCNINIDLTDLKEVLCSEKGIEYSYGEFDKTVDYNYIIKMMTENIHKYEELICKKKIVLIETGLNYCEEDKLLLNINDLLMTISESSKESYEIIFSLYTKEELKDKIKIGIVCN